MPIDATRPYDDSNIFARILREEIPSKSVYEDEHALAFHDINPQAPVHVLFIPKRAIATLNELEPRDAQLAGELFLAAAAYAKALEADPTYNKARLNLAALRCRFGDTEGAKRELSVLKDVASLAGPDVDGGWKACK